MPVRATTMNPLQRKSAMRSDFLVCEGAMLICRLIWDAPLSFGRQAHDHRARAAGTSLSLKCKSHPKRQERSCS